MDLKNCEQKENGTRLEELAEVDSLATFMVLLLQTLFVHFLPF